MKSAYEIKREMEKEFGKDFLNQIEANKKRYEEYQRKLKLAETREDKIHAQEKIIFKNFQGLSDDHSISLDGLENSFVREFAEELVDGVRDIKDFDKRLAEVQKEYIDYLSKRVTDLQKAIDELKELTK